MYLLPMETERCDNINFNINEKTIHVYLVQMVRVNPLYII